MLLAKLVALVVLVQEVKNVDRHPDVEEPQPVVWVREDLLFRITVGVIDKMLPVCAHGERRILSEQNTGKESAVGSA
jgi:hypothetical protein